MFQGPLCIVTIALNVYFVLTVALSNELKLTDYWLIAFQSSLDLLLTGVLGLVYYFINSWSAVMFFCVHARFYDNNYAEDE